MSFFATLALILVLVIRPQEIWPFLAVLRPLDVLTVLAAVGVVYEYLLARNEDPYSPQLPFLGAFLAISYVATLVNLGPAGLAIATTRATIGTIFMLVVMYGARSAFRLRVVMGLLAALAVFVSAVAVHQGGVERQCIELPVDDLDDVAAGTPDGRSCETAHGCELEGHGGVDYACERVGMFKTVSVGGRVRWRGQLNDPNELSVYIGAVIPFLVAFAAGANRPLRWLLVAPALALILYAVILAQSRGGQLVVGAVFAAFFVRRFGVKGVGIAALFALPVLLYGGRHDEGAGSSAEERIGLLYDGISFVIEHPLFGIGIDQFGERDVHTAHNAYLLAGSELGLPGMFAWTSLCWASLKIPITLMRRPPEHLAPVYERMSLALLASFAGMAVGIFFLSFTFKQVFFIWLGMAGALYGAVRSEHPTFEVRTTWRDHVGVALADLAILVLLFVYTRHHHP